MGPSELSVFNQHVQIKLILVYNNFKIENKKTISDKTLAPFVNVQRMVTYKTK